MAESLDKVQRIVQSEPLDPWLKSNERAKARRVRPADPDRFWWFWCLMVIGLVLSAAKFL